MKLCNSSIWEHMLEISQSRRTTIIITTHYVEEANMVCDGKLKMEGLLFRIIGNEGVYWIFWGWKDN